MKIKIKKIIASVLTFMMVFTQVPLASTNVYAADDNGITIFGNVMNVTPNTTFPIEIGDKEAEYGVVDTINIEGGQYSLKKDNRFFTIVTKRAITVNINGNIDVADKRGGYGWFIIGGSKNNFTINGKYHTVNANFLTFFDSSVGTASINDLTITTNAQKAIINRTTNSTISINNCTIKKLQNIQNSCALSNNGYAEITNTTIENGMIANGTMIDFVDETPRYNGLVLNNSNVTNNYGDAIQFGKYWKNNWKKIEIKSCTIKGQNYGISSSLNYYYNGGYKYLNINGNTTISGGNAGIYLENSSRLDISNYTNTSPLSIRVNEDDLSKEYYLTNTNLTQDFIDKVSILNDDCNVLFKSKALTVIKHTHNWVYEVNDNSTISARCTTSENSCSYNTNAVELKISADDMDYTGKAYSGLSLKDSDNNVVTDNKFPVTKNDIIIEYEGKDYTKSEIAPTAVGDYKVSVSVGEQKVTKNFKINKANSCLSSSPKANELTYNGKEQELVTAGIADGGTVYYSLSENDGWSTTIPKGKEAGKYRIYYYVKGDENHNDYKTDHGFVDVEIKKGTPSINVEFAKNLTYNSEKQNFIINAEIPKGTILKYRLNAKDKWTTEIPSAENAGEYTIYYKVEGGSNYNDSEEKSSKVKINQKEVTVSNIKANDKEYDGNNSVKLDFNDAHFDGKCGNDQLSVTADGNFTDVNAGENKKVSLSNLVLNGTDKNNYVLSQTGNQTETTATITPKSLTSNMVTLDGEDNTYMFNSRNMIKPVVTVKDGETALTNNDFEVSGEVEKTDYGTYTLNVVGKGNYQGTVPVQWSINENKAPTGTIKIGNNTINKVLNSLTFGYFFKETKAVTITGSDGEGESGVKEVSYYLANDILSIEQLENVTWIKIDNGKTFNINPNNKYVIYAKIVDNAGNSSIINSDGVVLYSDSTSVTEKLEYTKTTENDLTASVNLNGNVIKNVAIGNKSLPNNAYTVEDSTIAFNGKWLDTLDANDYTLTVSYNPLGVEYINNQGNQAPRTTTITLKVKKANGSITNIQDISKEYDGQVVKQPTFNKLGTGNDTIEYKVKDADDTTYTTIKPKDAGTYKVRVTVGEDGAYEATSGEKEFTITPKELNVTVDSVTKEYDGNKNASVTGSVTTGIDGETLTISGLTGTFNSKDVKYANKVTVDHSKVSITGKDSTNVNNYTLVYPESVTGSITPKTVKLQWKNTSLTYNGKEQLPTATVNNLVDGDKCEITVDGAQHKNAGTYEATATKVSNQNYKLPEDVTTSYTIGKKQLSIEDLKAVNRKYNGTSEVALQGGTLTGVVGNDKVSIDMPKMGTVESSNAGENKAVSYTKSTLKGEDKDNYELSETAWPALTVTISKTDQSDTRIITTSNELDKEYDGYEVVDVKSTSNNKTTPVVEYSVKGKNEYTTTKPKDAGEYTVRVTYPADDNYEKSSVTKDFTIKKMKTRVSAIDLSKTYGEKGYELMYSFDRLARGDRLTGIILTREEGEDVGTYKIKVSQKEGSNPNYDITFKDGTYTINPLSIDKGTVVLGNVLKYTGEKQTQEVEQVVINGKVLNKDDYEVLDNQATKEGKHVLTIKAKGNNHKGSFEYSYAILPKENDKIGTGSFTVKTTGDVEISRDEIIDLLIENKEITANELSEVAEGKKVEIVLEVKEAQTNELIETNTKGYKVGKYLDITLYKSVNGTNKSIHELTKVLKVTIKVPEELINKDSKTKREYYIARSHNGKVDILETSYDEKTNSLTFETDKFSDYAILYKDKKELKTTVTTSINKSNTKQTMKAKTGDNANIIGLMMLLVSSMFVMVFVRKKEN